MSCGSMRPRHEMIDKFIKVFLRFVSETGDLVRVPSVMVLHLLSKGMAQGCCLL